MESFLLNLKFVWYGKKENPQGARSIFTTIVGRFVGALTLISNQGDCRRICGLHHLEYDCDREMDGLATTSIWILGESIHSCSDQVVVPASGLVRLQNKVEGTYWSKNSLNCRSAWFGSSSEEVCQPKAWFAQGTESQSHPQWRVSPIPSWPEGLVETSENCVANGGQAKRGADRANNLQSKVSGPVQPGKLGCGSAWVKMTNRALLVLKLLFSLYLGRKSNS